VGPRIKQSSESPGGKRIISFCKEKTRDCETEGERAEDVALGGRQTSGRVKKVEPAFSGYKSLERCCVFEGVTQGGKIGTWLKGSRGKGSYYRRKWRAGVKKKNESLGRGRQDTA